MRTLPYESALEEAQASHSWIIPAVLELPMKLQKVRSAIKSYPANHDLELAEPLEALGSTQDVVTIHPTP